MLSLYNILTVARYEIKTLSRSWFFRVFAILSLVILVLGTIFILAMTNSPYPFRALSASIPYFNFKLLNLFQAIMAVFLAADFLKRDRKYDSTDVFYTRSMTNADYIFGKTLGIVSIFVLFNLLVAFITGIIHLAFANANFVILPYLLYFLFFSLPTLIFTIGLTMLIMSLIRSQALTFVIVLAFTGIVLFYLGKKFYTVFDFLGFFSTGMYSDIVGLGVPGSVIMLRLAYFLGGLSFIFLSVLLLKRLIQSKPGNILSSILGVVFLILSGYCLMYFIGDIHQGIQVRSVQRTLNETNAGEPRVTVLAAQLNINHAGDIIEGQARLNFQNNNENALDKYLFSLNPGLILQKIYHHGEAISFKREHQLIWVEPTTPLAPIARDSLEIHYSGTIDENYLYLDVTEKRRQEMFLVWLYNLQKRHAVIENDYVLLTPECLWYPVAGIPYGANYPDISKKDFIQFELTVNTTTDLTAIAQGKLVQQDTIDSNQQTFRFTPEHPLPNLSLIIGQYDKREIEVDSVKFALFTTPEHNYFVPYFSAIGDTLPALIREAKNDLAIKLALTYPFPRLTLIEVPIQFSWYGRPWTLAPECIQPEMVLLPELGAFCSGTNFKQMESRMFRRDQRSGQTLTEQEKQARFFNMFVNGNFMGEERGFYFFSIRMGTETIDYKIFPEYYYHVNHFHSTQWPIFNQALESSINNRIPPTVSSFFRSVVGLSDQEKANLALNGKTLETVLTDTSYGDIHDEIIRYKGDYLFLRLQKELGDETFNRFLNDFISANRFQDVSVNQFISALKTNFKFDFVPYFKTWYGDTLLPGFLVSNITGEKIMDGERTRFQTRMTIENPTARDGLVQVKFYSQGGGPRFRRGNPETLDTRLIMVKASERKEVGILLDEPARSVEINTLLSQNIPAVTSKSFSGEQEINKNARPFEGEKMLPPAPPAKDIEIIVDNEDSGFEVLTSGEESLLQRLFRDSESESREKYQSVRFWSPPGQWTPTTDANFYGELIHSAYIIKGGSGDQKVAWSAEITEGGQYEVFYHPGLPDMDWIWRRRRGGGRDGERSQEKGTLHFLVNHDDGEEAVELDLNNVSTGWNYLGTFYLSPGQAKVVLTDESNGRIVFADAMRWVKK